MPSGRSFRAIPNGRKYPPNPKPTERSSRRLRPFSCTTPTTLRPNKLYDSTIEIPHVVGRRPVRGGYVRSDPADGEEPGGHRIFVQAPGKNQAGVQGRRGKEN